MTTYIYLGGGGPESGGGGSAFWGDAVANFAALPAGTLTGECRITIDTQNIYTWTGAAWEIANTEVATVGHQNSDSVDLSSPGEVLQADLNISADAASANYLKATTTVKSGANKGIHVEIPEAASGVTGALTGADWDTFNGKEPAITAAGVNNYWRGDKSFQTLNIEALLPDASGSGFAANNKVLGVDTDIFGLSTTNVGATTVWGNAGSISLLAGSWLIGGMLYFDENGADVNAPIEAGFHNVVDTEPTATFKLIHSFTMPSGGDIQVPMPMAMLSSGSAFTVYLNTKFTYASGTPQHGGYVFAIRIR